MNKLNQLLIVSLVLQLAIATWLLKMEPTHDRASRVLFEGFKSSAAQRIEVSGRDIGSKEVLNSTVRIQKIGEIWGLIDADQYPVKEEQVRDLLKAIRKLTIGTPVTHRSAHHKKLKVSEDSHERRIKVVYAHGNKNAQDEVENVENRTIDFYIGTKPHRDRVHLRLADEDTVYVVSGLDSWDLGVNLGQWTSKAYVDVPGNKLWEVQIENAKGRFRLVRSLEEGWGVEDWDDDRPFDRIEVAALAKRAASVELETPLGKAEKPGYGLDKPLATVTLVTGTSTQTDRAPRQIEKTQYWIGAQGVDELYYVKAASSPYHVKTRPVEVSLMVELTHETLVKTEDSDAEK